MSVLPSDSFAILKRAKAEREAWEEYYAAQPRKRERPPRKRRTREQTRSEVRRLADDGLVVGAIADTLGLSDKTVRNYLGKRART